MITSKTGRIILACLLAALTVAGGFVAHRGDETRHRTRIVAHFENSTGIFVGDEVRILGVAVGRIDHIEPEAGGSRIAFWVDDKYPVPADAKAVILSPSLVTARAIQLTPSYGGGPKLGNDAVIPKERTAVPVEWDDFRAQLQKLTETLQPTQPGGLSTLGAFVDTAADNLRGRGADVHATIVQLSKAVSALGDHSTDIFSTVKKLSILVSALQSSADLMGQLNRNLDTVSGLVTNEPNEIGDAVEKLHTAISAVGTFVADNRDKLGVTSDRLADISTAINGSLDDLKQALHVFPTTVANFNNIYQPAQGALTGVVAFNQFANPISFICGAIQAASRMNAEQSSKLCVQYLAPIVKNRQMNFLPLAENLVVGAQARPNEITYSEDWLRPDYTPPAPAAPATADGPPAAEAPAPAAGDVDAALPPPPQSTDPSAGLPGLMLPSGTGS
jgi:phospholipid/cholesterol/gamma-HCH transport system substrate-binding protein